MTVFDGTAFTVLGEAVTWSEVVGDLSGLATVWLTVRRHVLNWPVGLVNTVFFGLLFLHARLYADAGLQVVFFVMGVWGWWDWVRAGGTGTVSGTTRVRTVRRHEALALVPAGAAAFLGLWWLLALSDDIAPARDAAVTVLSLVATYGQARALVESWWVWVVVDAVSIPLYLSQDLTGTAVVYAVFLAMCLVGLRDWRRQRARQDALALAA